MLEVARDGIVSWQQGQEARNHGVSEIHVVLKKRM